MSETDYGRLSVKATIGGGALPVKNAHVHIYGVSENNRGIEYSVITDVDGVTEWINLPAPPVALSLGPHPNESAYSLYNMDISADGYYTKRFFDIPVFDGISTVQNVSMIPKSNVYAGGVDYPRDNLNVLIFENQRLE